MIPSAETTMQVQIWRQKLRDKLLTQEDMKQIVAHLRAARGSVPQATAGSKVTKERKAAAKKPDGDALLAQLDLL